MNKLEMRRKRAAKVQAAQQLLDTVEARGDAMTADERSDYDGFMDEIESIGGDITRAERMEGVRQFGQEPQKPEPGNDGRIGMSEKDVRQFSLVRAINASAAARRGDRNPWKGAEFELEASRAVADRVGAEAQGFYVPDDVAFRDLTVGSAVSAGNLVDSDLMSGSFIELLRNKMMVQSAGATVLAGLVGNVLIPRQTGGATAYWVAESGDPTESVQTVDQVALTPKTVGAFTDYSRKLMLQSSLDVEGFVRGDLASVLALAIDLAALHGTGASNQPTGIAATSGIGSVVGGTNGLAPTWDHIVDLETEVAVDNADIGRLAYMTNAKVRGQLKKTFVDASSNAERVWDVRSGNTPLNGYGAFTTNQVSSALTKGSSSGVCSAIFYGNWSDLLIGMWGGLDILVDPYSQSTSGTMRVVALQDVDVAVRHPQSFAAMLDALTA